MRLLTNSWNWLMGEDVRWGEKNFVPDAVEEKYVPVAPPKPPPKPVDTTVVNVDVTKPSEGVSQIGKHMAPQTVERVKIFGIGTKQVEVHAETCGEVALRAQMMGARVELASMEELEESSYLTYSDHECRA